MPSEWPLRRFALGLALLIAPNASGVAFARPRPAVRTVELTLTAAPARLSLVPGKTTDVFAFNGQVPGPTLEFREGDHVVVHFRNELGEPSTIHWHGLHIPASADGSPLNLVKAGGTYDYIFDILPGAAGTYWYHPHPDHRTGRQITMGLYGALIIRAADDPLATMPEKVLVLSDNRFLPSGEIDVPSHASQQGQIDEVNGREGNVLFVNDQVMPTLSIRSGEVQRWRIINAAGARVYRLALAGHEFLQVGTDGGLFEHPVPLSEIVLATGERVEVLVRATGAPGSRAALRVLPYDRYVPQTRPADWTVPRDLLTLQYTDEAPVAPITVPTHLRAIPAIDTTHVAARRFLTFSQGLINGRTMDMHRVDERGRLGATEIWQVENVVGMDHPFHLHGFQFQVLDRNGVPEPFVAWKDMVNVRKHESVRFVVRYDDYPGRWMYHCHILDHEDHGMMGILEVTPPRR